MMKAKHVYAILDCPVSQPSSRGHLISRRLSGGMSDGQPPNSTVSTKMTQSPRLLHIVIFTPSVVSCLKYACTLDRLFEHPTNDLMFRFFPDTCRIHISFAMHRLSLKCTRESNLVGRQLPWSRISYGVLSICAGPMNRMTGQTLWRFRSLCKAFCEDTAATLHNSLYL
jgi:hypothetical protein